MKITVTGSLGHISQPLTRDLVQNGHEVLVISSSIRRRKDIEAAGASAAIGSILNQDFLQKTFQGADAVYCMVPPDLSQPDPISYYERVGRCYEQAIRKTGVRRVIHLSSYGAHLTSGTGFITGSNRIENLLNAIPDILLTHVRPTSFYYNLLRYIPMIKTAGFIGDVYGGDDRILMVHPQDIAKAISREIAKTTDIDRVVYVTSDEKTCNEIAILLGTAAGIPDLEWKALPKTAVFTALVNAHVPENAASMLVELGEAVHNGRLREDFDRKSPLSGKIKLEDFAGEFARAFHQN